LEGQLVNSSSAEKLPSITVERRSASDLPYETYLRDYVENNRPVVVEGAGSSWPALEKWTPEFFKTRFGPKMVDVSYEERMSFADFIDGVLASTAEEPGPYMYRLFICVHLPELLPDLDPPKPLRLCAPSCQPASAGDLTAVMHWRREHAFHHYRESTENRSSCFIRRRMGPTCIQNPMRRTFGKFKIWRIPICRGSFGQATRYLAILKLGDTIFVPSRRWHTARVLSPSVSVCTNQVDESHWNGFVREVCLPQRGDSIPKRGVKCAVLMALGLSLSAMERRRDKKLLPTSFASRIGRLSPWSPAEAISQGEWPRVRGASS
jgi:hypothetical protein